MTKAIIIDDDIDTVDVLREYLELKNIQILGTGHNGKDAVDLYQKLIPDVVFLDVMMPVYDGFYGLNEIKKQNPDACVIMVTGDLTSETADRLHALDACAIVYKPFDINELMETMETALKNRHPTNILIQHKM